MTKRKPTTRKPRRKPINRRDLDRAFQLLADSLKVLLTETEIVLTILRQHVNQHAPAERKGDISILDKITGPN
jgi:hypothetical protein